MNQNEFSQRLLPMKQKIFRFALSIIGDHAEAEDVVQDIYEKLWGRRDSLDECTNLDGFVMSSVRNLCLDRLRDRKLHNDKLVDVKNEMPRQSFSQSDSFDMKEIVAKVISTLPDAQQAVIHLRDVEGYEIDTIAQVVGMESATVRVNLSRARKKVKEEVIKIMSYGIR